MRDSSFLSIRLKRRTEGAVLRTLLRCASSFEKGTHVLVSSSADIYGRIGNADRRRAIIESLVEYLLTPYKTKILFVKGQSRRSTEKKKFQPIYWEDTSFCLSDAFGRDQIEPGGGGCRFHTRQFPARA